MRCNGDVELSSRFAENWTQRVATLVHLPQLLRQLGADPDDILRRAGLDAAALSHPENRVSYSQVGIVLDCAAAATSCPHLGLLVGRLARLTHLGLLGDVMRHSESVGTALESLAVYHHLNSDGGLVFLLRRGDFVDLGYAIYDPSAIAGAAQIYDVIMSAAMNFMMDMCGSQWRPYELFLPHARPRETAQYRALFKVTPRFDSELCALRFRARDLALPVVGADPKAYRLAEERARRAGPPDLLQQVYRGVRRLMVDNRHSGNDLAQMLSMHRRTLNRRLKAHSTTFQQVLDDVRFEVARDLLANSNVPLDDVAATLGYSAVTPFMRTFRRWSGTTPGQWRRNEQSRQRPWRVVHPTPVALGPAGIEASRTRSAVQK